jgi:hypothetical protein
MIKRKDNKNVQLKFMPEEKRRVFFAFFLLFFPDAVEFSLNDADFKALANASLKLFLYAGALHSFSSLSTSLASHSFEDGDALFPAT